jgi:NADPH:quinone reductase-like Zn-dependent oxidoreductase
MKAMLYRSYGGPEKLELVEIPKPTPGPGQILLKVFASSVNPVDWKIASGKMRFIMPAKFPTIPGADVAGEVIEVGAGATGFSIGMRVHARIAATAGASAEYAVAGIEVSASIPEGMGFAEAAGLPLAGMTALQGLRDKTLLPLEGAKEKVLIIGASGGVGHLAVQIAKSTGAFVVGVCSAKNEALVRSLGADGVIDYQKPDAFSGHKDFDIIYDCVSGDPSPWLPMLTSKGRYASCMPGVSTFLRSFLNPFMGRSVRPVMLKSNATDLQILDRLVDQKKLKVVIDSRLPLEKLKEAWERSLSGRAIGKIIIEVAP